MTHAICIRIPDAEWADLCRLAGRDGQNRTAWCRLLVRTAIQRGASVGSCPASAAGAPPSPRQPRLGPRRGDIKGSQKP